MKINEHLDTLLSTLKLRWPRHKTIINALAIVEYYFPKEYYKWSRTLINKDFPNYLAHKYEKHTDCQIDDCIICDWGLLICTTCNQGENELEVVCSGSISKIVTAANITTENNYKWKGAENTLVYKGYNWSVNAYRHEFALITRPDRVWCQVLTKDLNLMERICK